MENVQSNAHVPLAGAPHEVTVPIQRDVCRERLAGRRLLGIIIGDVRKDETQGHRRREGLAQHARIGHVERHLVGTDGHVGALVQGAARGHLAQREIAQRRAHGLVVADAIESAHVGQVDVVHQLAQPRRVVDPDPRPGDAERVFGRIPILGTHIRLGSRPDVAHGATPRVRSNGL